MASEGIVCEMAVAVSRRLVNDPHDLALSGRVLESGQPSIPAPPVADDAAAAAADASAHALLSGGSAMRGKKEATENGQKCKGVNFSGPWFCVEDCVNQTTGESPRANKKGENFRGIPDPG